MSVTSPIETLKKVFLKRCVLEITDVYKIMQTNSRTTAYRHLQKVGALSSYSHARKYYTLKEIPEFDENGLWHYGDISFSKYRTLTDTIVNLVSNCDRGKSCSELEKQQRVYVQNALLSLVNSKKLIRQEMNGIYIYYSSDPTKRSSQIHKRSSQKARAPLPDWVVMQVLVATLKCASGYVTAEDVTSQLKKQGSDITLGQVQKVFELHSLEKKTPDSAP